MSKEPARISMLDARLDVLAASLEPALVFARALRLGLDEVMQLVSVGYFVELRDRGLSWEAIARRLGKSRRTVASLARTSRDQRPPLEGSRRIRLRRRVVQVLGRGPSTRCDLERELGASTDDLDLALEELIEQRLIENEGDRLRVATAVLDLVGEDFEHRLDSLRHFVDGLTHVIYRRFFGDAGSGLARVYTFTARPERVTELVTELESLLRERAVAADAEASGHDDAREITVGFYAVERSTDLPFRARR